MSDCCCCYCPACPGPRPLHSRQAIVTQTELNDLNRLRGCAYAQRVLTTSIRQKLQAGAVVEAGPLWAELQQRQYHGFTLQNIAAVLGHERAAELQRQIVPKTFDCVAIQCNGVISRDPIYQGSAREFGEDMD